MAPVVVIPKGGSDRRTSKAGASDGELTPTQGRPPLSLRHTDLDMPRPLYGRQTFAQSQPALAPRIPAPAIGKQPARQYPPPVPPPQSPLPPIPQSAEDAEFLPVPYRPYGPQAVLKQRSATELRAPTKALPAVEQRPGFAPADALGALPSPKAYGHRRGGRNELPDRQAPGGPGRYVPDYSSAPSGSSFSSGFLSRGPSTTSTGRSELRTDTGALPLQIFGVQQDFFLSGLNLTSGQRRLLLVSLPHDVLQTYRLLYANDLAYAVPYEPQALAHAQLRARGDLTLLPHDQQKVLRACLAVQATPWGNERLARLVRWVLQADLEEQCFKLEYAPRKVPALSAQQLKEILGALRLDFSQQARLNKHCSAVEAEPLRPMQSPSTAASPY
jgi:hypothetical protein